MMEVLLGCDVKHVKSVVIPVIGTGMWGFPGDQVAELMYNAIMSFFSWYRQTSVQKVTLVVDITDISTYEVSTLNYSIIGFTLIQRVYLIKLLAKFESLLGILQAFQQRHTRDPGPKIEIVALSHDRNLIAKACTHYAEMKIALLKTENWNHSPLRVFIESFSAEEVSYFFELIPAVTLVS